MMQLYIKTTNNLITISKNITTFCLKNAEVYRQIYYDISDSIIISVNSECIDIEKKVSIIKNVSDINCNDKKILNYIYRSLEKDITPDLIEKLGMVNHICIEMLDELIDKSEFNLVYNPDIGINKLLSIMEIKVENYEHTNFLRYLLQYINLVNYLTKSKIFITYSLMNYITNDEYYMLVKELELMDIYIINFEMFTANSVIDFIVDEDNCIY